MTCAPLVMLALSLASPAQPSAPAVTPMAISIATPGASFADSAATTTQERPPELRVALDAVIVQAITVEALKHTIKDKRPVGSGYAFPSGHATAAFSLARVASEYHPRYKWLWYGIAARIAWSRVKVKAHDWDDVLAGAALGCWIGDIETDRGGIVLGKWQW